MPRGVWPYILVGLGGFIGANARFLVSRWAGLLVPGVPVGTFLINISGSLLLGFLGAFLAGRVVPNDEALRLGLGVGFLGTFTTFSTFELEAYTMVQGGEVLAAALYVGLSVALGFLAVRAGVLLAGHVV